MNLPTTTTKLHLPLFWYQFYRAPLWKIRVVNGIGEAMLFVQRVKRWMTNPAVSTPTN